MKSKTHQKLWDSAKAVLREKFLSLNVYIRNIILGNKKKIRKLKPKKDINNNKK